MENERGIIRTILTGRPSRGGKSSVSALRISPRYRLANTIFAEIDRRKKDKDKKR